MLTQDDLRVPTLGPCRFDSPKGERRISFTSDSARIRYHSEVDGDELSFEQAGPRERLFFDPRETTAAFVTCGGLSPGLNNVIRSGFSELAHNYGVRRVLGLRDGYLGLNPESGRAPIVLTHEFVHHIHELGGTVLSSSRGPQDPDVMADFLEERQIDVLFCIGGDGTQRGAHALQQEVQKRGLAKSIVGIPKTIDNDIPFVWMSFGYATALERAEDVLRSAHTEAIGAPNGIGLVKLMGRDAGFIAAGAAVASQDANFVLVPEVAFPLEGEQGFLAVLDRRIADRGHALVVVAQGAGQHLFQSESGARDASGNVRHQDIGLFLRDRITAHFEDRGIPINLKYIDPSYVIRSAPANTWDRILSDRMARSAVHAGMAGKTDVVIGWWNQALIHVPIRTCTAQKRRMVLTSDLWNAVLSTTGQPRW
jgi:6-phosphofructokinase 1